MAATCRGFGRTLGFVMAARLTSGHCPKPGAVVDAAPREQLFCAKLSGKPFQDEVRTCLGIDFRQDDRIIPKPREGIQQPMIFGDAFLEFQLPLAVRPVDFRPWRGQENLPVEPVRPIKGLRGGHASCVLQRYRRIDRPRSKKTHPFASCMRARSKEANLMARLANAPRSTQGSILPLPRISSTTILLPGSSTVSKPRRLSSASSVEFPPPEQPYRITCLSATSPCMRFSPRLRFAKVERRSITASSALRHFDRFAAQRPT